jgi:MoCo/4Fe-4S cofactor protein with predicted Tat translocation signal
MSCEYRVPSTENQETGNLSTDCKTERAKKPVAAQPLELEKVREALTSATGPTYWRSLEELSNTEGFQEMLHREFPRQASELTDDFSRRNFLKVMGASLALAGLSACTKQPIEHILPYVRQPEEEVPGKPLYYATVMSFAGRSVPVLVKANEGRPIKVDGNPDHPAGQEGSDIFAQASILDMYDPDRSQNVLLNNDGSSWGAFLGAIRGPLTSQKGMQGDGLRLLTGAVTSPTMAAQLDGILKLYPKAKWHKYEPLAHDNQTAAFGQPVSVQHNFENADVILSLDSDFLTPAENPSFLRDALAFSKKRKAENGDKMNRLYVVESGATSTGGKADHRLPLRGSDIENFARAIAAKVGAGSGGNSFGKENWIAALASDLQAHRGSSVVLAGRQQPPAVHALAFAMNQALGSIGKTITYSEALDYNPPNHQGDLNSLRDLVKDIDAGKVNLLVFVGTNPMFNAPVDLAFDEARMKKVDLRVHFGQYQDETAKYCHWHVPESHYLEAWSDVRCADGTMSIVQPLIAPLYMSKSVHEFLGPFVDQPTASGYETVQGYWKAQHSAPDFDVWWRRALHNGFMENTGGSPKPVSAKSAAASSSAPALNAGEIEILFRPDPNIYDGRFANNGWLQELPKPITMLTWENAALVSFPLAEKLKIVSGDQVDIESNGRKLTIPIWITAGLPENSVVLYTGYGHSKLGRFGTDSGWNTYALRTSGAPDIAVGKISKSSESSHLFGAVHLHHNIEGRGTVRVATVEEFAKNPRYAHNEEEYGEEPSKDFTIYHQKEFRYEPNSDTNTLGYAWGMAIDLNSCIGCNTCMVACQAENNISIVGRDEVIRGREMHWIRVDNYFTGDGVENFQAHFQPVPCMQCENAPCEVVCPVAATSHSSEGLNDMVYNRCVGTRYCSNNCPYKVRRFNFFLFADYETPSLKLLHNPDVTVRSRGVMEKCTYCVQRINRARISTEIAETRVGDDLHTACQQACPADAIVFGDINNPNSRVSKLKAQPRDYSLLADLNTRPRTTYLATVMNPNPALGEVKGTPATKVEHGKS